jgi:pre-mRNA-processing factor 19
MFCAVSGSVPEAPVVSTKSGHVFERSVAEKYVKETGKDPVTGEPLSVEELLQVKANKAVKPRTAAAASIPGMLGLFHDEWDALMLETHALRQSLHSARQELSHALYQHDAACRVIARVIRERDEARGALETIREQVQAEMSAAAGQRGAEGEEAADDGQPAKRAKKAGISQEVLDELTEVNATLSKGRKKRAVSPSIATAEEVASLTSTGAYPVHGTRKPGITCIDVSPGSDSLVRRRAPCCLARCPQPARRGSAHDCWACIAPARSRLVQSWAWRLRPRRWLPPAPTPRCSCTTLRSSAWSPRSRATPSASTRCCLRSPRCC